ncbi:MAG: alpha/beta hydrolase [Deltaproteobacteria bacterium]|nr:alpha/beta hydrolase [Deltaproteobacteria bacterium]
MVHGLATNLAFWYIRYVSAFSKRYRVTLYNLRGHGRSSITDSGYTPKNIAVDLQQLLDHLSIECAHFIAHSFGGVVALNLARLNPGCFASLILVDTHISVARRIQKTKDWEFGKKIKPILEQHGLDVDVREPYFGYKLLSAVAHLQIQNVEISQELEDLVSPLMENNSKRTANQWLKLMETTQAEKELMGDDGLSLDNLRKLNFPILAMYGEHSQAMSTGEQLLEVWPHADFRRIRGAGHFFPITRSSELMENCRQFWNGS